MNKPTALKMIRATALGLAALLSTTTFAGENKPTNASAPEIALAKWTKLRKILPADGTLLEGSYLGQGEHTDAEYRLHLLRFLDREDSFISLMESEAQDIAVLGFLIRDRAGTYQWKQVSANAARAQIEPLIEKDSMYTLDSANDKKGRLKVIELAPAVAGIKQEVVRFYKGRTALMHRNLLPGKYVAREDKHLNISINARPDRNPENLVWHLVQKSGGKSGQASRYVARFDLPGVLTARKDGGAGFDPNPTQEFEQVVIGIQYPSRRLFWEKRFEQLIVFEVTQGKSFERKPNVYTGEMETMEVPSGENDLTRPEHGYRLTFSEPEL